MFKLESYVSPFISQYLGRYIKDFEPSHLQMSLWEGWAKLENLELNLDALEKEFGALPLRITNGNIRALKISLPWTRLMQEPIRVHASCLEIAVELKEPGETKSEPEVKKAEPSERSPSPSEFEIVESPGAGYLDTLISRVVNNIVFQLENVIVKYSADGVVLTFHIQEITFAPCDQSWQEAFLDLLPDPELVLRRKLQIKDFTICLDQRTEGGDIKVFQDPFLYRTGAELQITHCFETEKDLAAVLLPNVRNTKVEVVWEELQVSLSPAQLPALLSLIERTAAALEALKRPEEESPPPVHLTAKLGSLSVECRTLDAESSLSCQNLSFSFRTLERLGGERE